MTLTRRQAVTTGLAAAVLPLILPSFLRAQETREVVELAIGDPDAPLTVVEYMMYTCPHCANFHRDVFPQIKANFIDTGKVRFVFREVYFNRPSLWAALIARCAPQDRYVGLTDLLFQRQSTWAGVSDPNAMVAELMSIGRQAGLTDAEMNACLSDREFAEALVADFQTHAAADGIDSTPSFIIDGTKYGNMSYADFEARLNAALGS